MTIMSPSFGGSVMKFVTRTVLAAVFFACTLALAWPDGREAVYEGTVQGRLTWPPRGARGFGYDPVFVAQGMSETFAEIDPDEKHRISHRADAFAKLVAAQFGDGRTA